MTDLEMTMLCATALGYVDPTPGINGNIWVTDKTRELPIGMPVLWNPLTNDAQAMALVKRIGLDVHCRQDRNGWYVGVADAMYVNSDLNRAIVECVATMQAEKAEA